MLPETAYDMNEDKHVQKICSIAGLRERTHDAPVEPSREIEFPDQQEEKLRPESFGKIIESSYEAGFRIETAS